MRLFLLLALALPPATLLGQTHPLDELTKTEAERAVAVIKADPRYGGGRFITLGRKEPAKEAVLAWRPGTSIPRIAEATLFDPRTTALSEVLIDLGTGKIEKWAKLPGRQPALTHFDLELPDSLLRNDARWIAAIKRRKVDPATVMAFGVPAAGYFPVQPNGNRVLAAVPLYKGAMSGQVTGLLGLVDLTTRKVLQVSDRGGPSFANQDVDVDSVRKLQPAGTAPKPLETSFPDGNSINIAGNEVSWLDWKFRIGVEERSGLILYQASFRDRPVLYRAAPSEMAVPYGDPGWRLWTPLDIGWVGLGGDYSKTSLAAGFDVPRYARFFASEIHDEDGTITTNPNAAAVYERDGGVLWRHGDEARRARDLVVTFFAKVDNYDYGFSWIFHQDGTLELQAELTGQMGTKAVAPNDPGDPYGTRVSRGVVAPNHQHFFNFRIDLDVDGPANRAVEMNVVGEPGALAKAAGLRMQETVLRTELGAIRSLNLESHRMWKFESATRKNALDQPTAYALMPGENSTPMVPPSAQIRRQVGFVNAHVWVTPERDDERYAAGDYAFVGEAGDGLPRWTKANRPIVDRDIVLWYTMGITHIPRPEDWPLMPVHRAGFKLVPIGFSSENPTIAIPR